MCLGMGRWRVNIRKSKYKEKNISDQQILPKLIMSQISCFTFQI